MKNYKMTIQYDGTDFYGWQRQKKQRSVQATIEEALSKILKVDTNIRGAGRTDAGVHALEQVATFKGNVSFSLENLKKALNSLLPPSIRVFHIEEVDPTFHPQYSAKRKSYVYYLCNDSLCSPFLMRYVWNLSWELNLQAIKRATEHFLGRANFSAFSGSTEVKDKVRTIFEISVEPTSELNFLDMVFHGNFIKFRIEADGFLKYMARNIVGVLVEIGRGALEERAIIKALIDGVRPTPLRTAPPQGLFLEKIYY